MCRESGWQDELLMQTHHAHIVARMELGAPLSHDDVASTTWLPARKLQPKVLGLCTASVVGRTSCLLCGPAICTCFKLMALQLALTSGSIAGSIWVNYAGSVRRSEQLHSTLSLLSSGLPSLLAAASCTVCKLRGLTVSCSHAKVSSTAQIVHMPGTGSALPTS